MACKFIQSFAEVPSALARFNAHWSASLEPLPGGRLLVDFNIAYNPYCAYNDTYECPFPPPSNRLKLEVRAGEKAPGI